MGQDLLVRHLQSVVEYTIEILIAKKIKENLYCLVENLCLLLLRKFGKVAWLLAWNSGAEVQWYAMSIPVSVIDTEATSLRLMSASSSIPSRPFPLRTVIPVCFSSSSQLMLQLPFSVASVP